MVTPPYSHVRTQSFPTRRSSDLAIGLHGMWVNGRSWLGWQLPLRSSDAHAAARIDTIDTGALNAAMAGGEVAVIPGFQGVADIGRVTTLGRGGSDTSAEIGRAHV